MTPAVQITLIICVTLIVLVIFGNNTNGKDDENGGK